MRASRRALASAQKGVLGFRVWGLGAALIQVVFVQTSHHICPSHNGG